MSTSRSTDTTAVAPLAPGLAGAPLRRADVIDEAGSSQELWLLHVPRHSVLRRNLVGREIALDDPDALNRVRGNYRFHDAGVTDAVRSVRPLLVDGEGEDARYSVGPAFSRQVDVLFTGSEMVPVAGGAPERKYPEPPTGLTVKYRPLGPTPPRVTPTARLPVQEPGASQVTRASQAPEHQTSPDPVDGRNELNVKSTPISKRSSGKSVRTKSSKKSSSRARKHRAVDSDADTARGLATKAVTSSLQ